VEWRRGWTYNLRWERGHSGVLSRTVRTPRQLRAVVEWARRNPHVEKCSYKLAWELEGDLIEACPAGHSLLSQASYHSHQQQKRMRLVQCIACPGHYETICPKCQVRVFDPPAGPDCGPPSDCRLDAQG
jgi:hypothetical protein